MKENSFRHIKNKFRKTLPAGSKSEISLSRRHGFTFVEVLIAISILAFGLTGILKVFFGSMYAVRHVKNRLQVNNLIEEQKWLVLTLIRQGRLGDNYKQRATVSETSQHPQFLMDVSAKSLSEKQDFYDVNIEASWKESGINKRTNRSIFLQKPQKP